MTLLMMLTGGGSAVVVQPYATNEKIIFPPLQMGLNPSPIDTARRRQLKIALQQPKVRKPR